MLTLAVLYITGFTETSEVKGEKKSSFLFLHGTSGCFSKLVFLYNKKSDSDPFFLTMTHIPASSAPEDFHSQVDGAEDR